LTRRAVINKPVYRGGSDDILQQYYESIGGRPVQKSPKGSRKRSGGSSATPAKSAKKLRTSIATQSGGSTAMSPEEPKEAKWKPPAGNWEEAIAAIDTIEKTEQGLVCYVQW
jgi:chromobox protein 1